mgnify:CR=1 FL=1
MSSKFSFAAPILVLLMALAAVTAAGEPSAEPAPKALFVEKSWEFEPVLEGAEVVHGFVVKNQGLAPLKITNVKTS